MAKHNRKTRPARITTTKEMPIKSTLVKALTVYISAFIEASLAASRFPLPWCLCTCIV